MSKKLKTFYQGQSLLEAIVALGVITIVIMGLIRAGVVGVRNSSSSETQAQTARYATEATEWLRNEESAVGWTTFSSMFSVVSDYYCLPNTPLVVTNNFSGALGGKNVICGSIPGTGITRKVSVFLVGPQLEISVDESWTEGNNQRMASYHAQFSPPANP